jgi:hypothetical protein
MKTIFVSSTYEDLKDERAAAIDLLDRSFHAVAMEKFFPADHQSKAVCLARLQKCDACVLIIGERYGSLDPIDQVSITEIEYNIAKTLGIPVFPVIKVGAVNGEWKSSETDPDRLRKHQAFKSRADAEKYRKTFQTSDQLRVEIFGAIYEYEREQGELGVRIPPFADSENYFRPLTNPANLFNHCWRLIGRGDYLAALSKFRNSTKRIALLYGRGTIGKSKILFEFAKRTKHRQSRWKVLFLRDGVSLTEDGIRQIPVRPTIIVVDDAHRRADLKLLLAAAQQYPNRIKLVLSSRPQGIPSIKTALSEMGFDPSETQELGEVKDLTKDQVRQLARQSLGTSREAFVEPLRLATGDSPLVLLVAGKLLATDQLDPRLLEQHGKFQDTVLTRFEDTLVGNIGTFVDPERAKQTLALIAALSPIYPQQDSFQSAAADILGIDKPTVISLIATLEQCGVLLRRGNSLRIVPDVLSDHLLRKECLTNTGQPTGYADLIYEKSLVFGIEGVLKNLAELDWRVAQARRGPDLLNRIWAQIERQFRNGSNSERCMLLESIHRIAYYQPERSLALVEFALRSPSRKKDPKQIAAYYSHEKVLQRLPKIVQVIGHNLDYLPRCCELLWQLGRDDKRPTNQITDHPMRVLTELAAYQFRKPLRVNEIVLTSAEAFIKTPNAQNYAHSPFDIIDALLAREVLDFQSEGIQFSIRSLGVNFEATKTLRQRAIRILEEFAYSTSPDTAFRAVKSLLDAIRSPHGMAGRRLTDQDIHQWTPESLQILNIIRKVANSTKHPIIFVQVSKSLRWYQLYSSNRTIRTTVTRILRTFPNTFQSRLTKAIWFHFSDWYDEFEGKTDRDYEKLRLQTENAVRRIAVEFIQKCPDPLKGFDVLAQTIENIGRVGITLDASYFISLLSATNPVYAAALCRLTISRPNSAVAIYMSSLPNPLRNNTLDDVRQIVRKGIARKHRTISLALAHFLSYFPPDELQMTEIKAIEALLKHPDTSVKNAALWALKNFKNFPKRAIKLITRISLAGTPELANAAYNVFDDEHGIAFSNLNRHELAALVKKVEPVPEIKPGGSIDKFLGRASQIIPGAVLTLILKRLERRREDGDKHTPMPYHGFHHCLRDLSSNPIFESLIERILKFAYRAKDIQLFWLPILFQNISEDYGEKSLKALKAWTNSQDPKKLEAVSLLLRNAPTRLLFEKKHYVIDLLNKAHARGDDCYRTVSSNLFCSGVEGERSGSPGEPKPQDELLRDSAREVMQTLQVGSPPYRFYASLARYAEDNIKDDLIRFEEDFAD